MSNPAGYDAVLSLGGDDISAHGKVISLERNKTVLNRTGFGAVAQVRAGGIQGLRFTFEAMVEEADYQKFDVMFAAATAAFDLDVGDSAGNEHAGNYAGTGVVSRLSVNGDVEGDWLLTIELESTGAVTYTAPV